jgi:hypothetical protein
MHLLQRLRCANTCLPDVAGPPITHKRHTRLIKVSELRVDHQSLILVSGAGHSAMVIHITLADKALPAEFGIKVVLTGREHRDLVGVATHCCNAAHHLGADALALTVGKHSHALHIADGIGRAGDGDGAGNNGGVADNLVAIHGDDADAAVCVVVVFVGELVLKRLVKQGADSGDLGGIEFMIAAGDVSNCHNLMCFVGHVCATVVIHIDDTVEL